MLDAGESITEEVMAAMASTPDPRTLEVLRCAVRHLHDFVREVDLTEAEWATAVDFLTRTGQMCSPQRQEFILLSDVLGVTMLVDAVNNRRVGEATGNSVLGPFFREDRPIVPDGHDISAGLPGVPLVVHARITDTAGLPVPGAHLDVWHSDAEGHYDSDIAGLDDTAMRGQFRASDDGRVTFRSIAPASYPIPSDGPVGELMRACRRSVMRPAHVHVRISAPGFSTLTTMVFRSGDPYLDGDPVFGVKPPLVAEFPFDHEDQSEHLHYTFVLQRLD
ncbi:dioxygenase [Mycolicibacterium sp.]|uniref:dioxygenase family protein n=1 Tax=Mycolicibacterium sp. TaxID=2320850 RepID=UPI003D0B5B06